MKKKIDWMVTLVPFIIIVGIAVILFIWPRESNDVIHQIRFFLGDTLGSYYLIIGLGVLLISVYLAFSKYGNIVLGEPDEKPKYSFFVWGSMMFTCGGSTNCKNTIINQRTGRAVLLICLQNSPCTVSIIFNPLENVPTQSLSSTKHNPCILVNPALGAKKENSFVFKLKRFNPPSSVPIHNTP